MTEAKFTPGPWEVNTNPAYSEGDPWVIWGPQGPGHGMVAHVAPWCPPRKGWDPQYTEYVANAHLIAAAPELYEALDELSTAADCVQANFPCATKDGYDSLDSPLIEWSELVELRSKIDKAITALAKAQGEA
jgi:hypothetical protein